MRQISRLVWTEKGVFIGDIYARCVHTCMWLCKQYVIDAIRRTSSLLTQLTHVLPQKDIITLIVLRGVQGIGAAATIPASVSLFRNLFYFRFLTHLLVSCLRCATLLTSTSISWAFLHTLFHHRGLGHGHLRHLLLGPPSEQDLALLLAEH